MSVKEATEITIQKYNFSSILKEELISPPQYPAQMNLAELVKHYKLDSHTPKGLFSTLYERYLKNSRPSKFSLLEVGVGNGSSLKMWSNYFPQGSIFGLDIHPTCASFCKKFKSVHISIGNPSDPVQMPRQFIQNFDLIIETASHITNNFITSFNNLWPKLKSGGLYFIEDPFYELHSSKESSLTKPSPLSIKRWFSKSEHPDFHSFLQSQLSVLENNNELEFIHCYPKLCILRKK